MKNAVTKYLLILLAISFILVITISYLLYLKKSAPQANPQATTEAGQEETTSSPLVTPPIEGNIGTVMDVAVQPNGKVKITVNEKTYLLPADQKVKLYTSDTESVSVSIDQLKKGTIVNVIKFTKPEKYEIFGTSDKALVGKLL